MKKFDIIIRIAGRKIRCSEVERNFQIDIANLMTREFNDLINTSRVDN